MTAPTTTTEEPRPASPPVKGLLRDVVRTSVAFVVAFGFTKLTTLGLNVDLSGLQESLVVIITSAILAYIGKVARDHGFSLGILV